MYNSPMGKRLLQIGLALLAALLVLTLRVPAERGIPGASDGAAVPLNSAPPETAAIRELLEQQDEAWNRGDLDQFMEAYWHDPGVTFLSGGRIIQGWEKVKKRYERRYRKKGQEMGHLEFSNLKIQLLGPEGAFARGRWDLARKKDHLGGYFTLILQKTPKGWRIIHDHTSADQP